MKKVLGLVISLAMIGFVMAQEGSDPMVEVGALSIASGTIASHLAEMYGEEDSCADLTDMVEDDMMDDGVTPGLSCLLQLVMAANLVETLDGEGPFTVFAPTNDGIREFLEDNGTYTTFGDLAADTEMLTAVLMHHVVPMGMSLNDMYVAADADVTDMITLETAGGTEITVSFAGDLDPNQEGVVEVGDGMMPMAYVNHRTISVDNGYIIPIDNVLVPPME